jgi:hypothetical protein
MFMAKVQPIGAANLLRRASTAKLAKYFLPHDRKSELFEMAAPLELSEGRATTDDEIFGGDLNQVVQTVTTACLLRRAKNVQLFLRQLPQGTNDIVGQSQR